MNVKGVPFDVKRSEMLNLANASKMEKINQEHGSFAEALKNNIQRTNELQINADRMDKMFAAGLVDNISDVAVASTKADIAVSYTVEIVSKVLNAYNEIMRMQL